jgi:hypothetical protein
MFPDRLKWDEENYLKATPTYLDKNAYSNGGKGNSTYLGKNAYSNEGKGNHGGHGDDLT